jgi:hypothetical protein
MESASIDEKFSRALAAGAAVILFEPAATRNTGNVVDDRFTSPDGNHL